MYILERRDFDMVKGRCYVELAESRDLGVIKDAIKKEVVTGTSAERLRIVQRIDFELLCAVKILEGET